ncbi:MAG: N-acetylneuraminate synthase family protein [Deltaproteobacteria bacterium]|nr:N-acetylneuraminate synthase family protein [Deltaproteobacteria bacterium]
MSLWESQGQLFVAEIGGNHGGQVTLAAELVKAASRAGFGAVKFQAYRTERFLHQSSPYYDELKSEELAFEDLYNLGQLAQGLSLSFGLTVFDLDGLELAQAIGCDFIKISSGDLTYHPLILAAAQSKIPLVLSTGASNQDEVDQALALTKNQAYLLQCASLYPAPERAINLAVMDRWLQNGLRAGLSDHSLALEPMKWAYFLGARIIEKHFTLDRGLPGGDNSMSLEPAGMAQLLAEIEALKRDQKNLKNLDRAYLIKTLPEQAFWGQELKRPQLGEKPSLIRRYALASREIKKGEKLSLENIVFKRLSPQMIKNKEILTPDQDLSNLIANSNLPFNEPIFLSAII